MQTFPFPIRETQPAKPIPSNLNDPAYRSILPEPIVASHNIQGSIHTGFNKNHRILLFLSVDSEKLSVFKTWLRSQIPFVATADEVIAFSRLFKATRQRRKREGTVKSTWMNISFSYSMLSVLNHEAEQFRDEAFREGLAKRTESLGDPTKGRYGAENWLAGGPGNEADVMLMIEADDRADLLDEYSRIQDSIDNMIDDNGNRIDPGIRILFKDERANLPPPLTGHEHFGFLDGVSQPGLRGLLSPDKTDVLTIRQNPNKRDQTNEKGQIVPAQGKPGQDLLYPGEFIFGYPRQIPEPDEDRFDGLNADPGDDSLEKDPFSKGPAGPAWAKDGSYLVYRRLHQDVGAFHSFLHDIAEANHITDPSNASAARRVGAKLVGRWPSGAPVERMHDSENPALGDDDCKNNNFEFKGDADAIEKQPNDPSACVDDDVVNFPQAKKDSHGLVCPFSAHIRKAYPRDDEPRDNPPPSDPKLSESATQNHRLLRRGLPYGPVSRSTPDAPIDDDADRGLQFLAYQTSIVNHFEFVTKNWVNAEDFKEPFDEGGGHDPIIGQNSKNNRIRSFTLTFPDPNKPGTTKTVKKRPTSSSRKPARQIGYCPRRAATSLRRPSTLSRITSLKNTERAGRSFWRTGGIEYYAPIA
jgi:Dyp-type peroxidase family